MLCELCDTICISKTALKEHSTTLDFKNHMISKHSLKEDKNSCSNKMHCYEFTDGGIYWPIHLQLIFMERPRDLGKWVITGISCH